MARIAAMTMVAMFLLTAGCETAKVSDKNISEVTEKQVVELSPDEKVALVDVRKPEAYRAGHIPNAINIYLPDIREKDRRLAGVKQIIVYGDGWTDPLPTAATKRLLALKYGNVMLFRGGVEVWKKAGHGLVEIGEPSQGRPETTGPNEK